MRSDKQSEASRNNGKKSQGPVTEQGKANSARNAESHNLSGGHISLLSNEDPNEFAALEDEYLQRFQPMDGVEYDLVQKMICASWRERRIICMETALFEIEMARQRDEVRAEFPIIDPAGHHVLAVFGTTDATQASALLLRYASAARRAYAGAFRNLRELQGERFHRRPPNYGGANPYVTPHRPSPPAEPNEPAHSPEQSAPSASRNADSSAKITNAVVPIVAVRRAHKEVNTPNTVELQNEPGLPSLEPATPKIPLTFAVGA